MTEKREKGDELELGGKSLERAGRDRPPFDLAFGFESERAAMVG